MSGNGDSLSAVDRHLIPSAPAALRIHVMCHVFASYYFDSHIFTFSSSHSAVQFVYGFMYVYVHICIPILSYCKLYFMYTFA